MAGTKIQLVLEAQNQASAAVKQLNKDVEQLGNTTAAANKKANTATGNTFVYDPAPYKKTGAAAAGAANQLNDLNRTATTTRQGLNALRGTVALIGLQAFPQMTTAVMAGTSALQGVRGVALLTGGSLTAVGAAVAALAAVVATGATAWSAYTAKLQGATAADARMAQQTSLNMRLRQLIRENEDRLPEGEAEALRKRLAAATPEGFRTERRMVNPGGGPTLVERDVRVDTERLDVVQAEIRERLRGVLLSQEEQEQFKKLGDLHAEIHQQRLEGFAKERSEALEAYELEQARILEFGKSAATTEDFQKRQFVFNDARLKYEEKLAAIAKREQAARTQSMSEIRTWDAERERKAADFYKNEERLAAEVEDFKARTRVAALDGLAEELALIDLRYDAELEKLEELKLSLEEERELRGQINAARDQEKNKVTEADAERSAQKEAQLRQQRLQGTEQMFSDMGEAAKAFGKEGFAAYKAFASAAALIDTYGAAIAAYKSVAGIPIIGPALAPVAAAAAIAAGLAQVAAINSQSYDTGGFTGFGGDRQPAGVVHKNEVVIPAWRVREIGVGPALDFAFGNRATPRATPDFSFQQGGHAAGAPSGNHFNFALVDDRQTRREWDARKGTKALLNELARRGNAVKL